MEGSRWHELQQFAKGGGRAVAMAMELCVAIYGEQGRSSQPLVKTTPYIRPKRVRALIYAILTYLQKVFTAGSPHLA